MRLCVELGGGGGKGRARPPSFLNPPPPPRHYHSEDGKFDLPAACSDAGCRSRAFKPDYASARAVDWQKLRLQELEADSADAGRVPRTLEVELCEDLVDACVPGDVVTVGGVVKAIEAEAASGARGSGSKRVFLM